MLNIQRLKNKKIYIFVFIIVLLIHLGNNVIDTTVLEISSKKLPHSFDGYTIVHISDLHNKNFGHNQNRLINKIKKQSPNIIVITGDLVYKRSDDISNSVEFINEVVKIAPVYFVTGNHENSFKNFDYIKEVLNNSGVVILQNESIKLYFQDDFITLHGINDCKKRKVVSNTLSKMNICKNNYNILLSHRPELIDIYSSYEYDLVFSGHAHGGQIRIPFIGALFSPEQGLFPKYTSGKHQLKNTTEVISRGLGKSIIPIRIFNNPEIVVCKLRCEI